MCGTCYIPTVTQEYVDKKGVLRYGTQSKRCGMDNKKCADGFLASFPQPGHSRKGYYDPHHTSVVKNSVAYTGSWMAAFLVPCCMLGIDVIVVTALIVMKISQRFGGARYTVVNEDRGREAGSLVDLGREKTKGGYYGTDGQYYPGEGEPSQTLPP